MRFQNFCNFLIKTSDDFAFDVISRYRSEMAAVVAVVRVIADEEIMSALVNIHDSFNDFARLLNRMFGDDDVTDFDCRRSVDENRFAVGKRWIH